MHGLLIGRPGLSTAPEKVLIDRLVSGDSPRTGGVQAEHVKLLAETEGALPPIVVHRATMRVIDGMHRLKAAVLRGDGTIDAVFFSGDDLDAFALAVELNHAHGLPLSAADRKVAAARIIASHPAWSDRRVSAVTGLSPSTVATIRACSTVRIGQSNARVGRDGRLRPLDGAEARRRAAAVISANPRASLRDIAKEARISPSTARDVRARLARGEDPLTPRQQQPDTACGPAVEARRAPAEYPPGVSPIEEQRARRKGGRGARRGGPRDASSAEFVALLARDPSLRLTDAGRSLLRYIGCVAVDDGQWDEMVRRVPSHQRETVVRVARECAAVWQVFAERLERQVAMAVEEKAK
ncbi:MULTISPECIES: ParB/RepB/Spo0J family partition protein [Amycolatopsis]|uniref:ParB/RepB/Spo0J family partition protein n=1 Tax=Amycolatopsis sp. cg13 TaxID=3238807 RepID=UPI003526174B